MNTNLETNIPSIAEDITGCRASDIGIADIGECLRGGPNACSYALPFGYCFLCRHPRLQEIIANTIKAAQVTGSINPN